MRLISQAILDAANTTQAQTPCMFVDVYASTQARGALDSQGQWIGTNDPMVGSDANMSYTRVIGAATLGAGAAVAPAYGGTPVLADTLSMRGSVVCRWHAVWNWKGTSWSPALDGWTEKITSQISEKRYPFNALATVIANSVIIRADIVLSTGLAAKTAYAYLVDSTGRQIGNKVTFTPTTTTTNYTITGLQASLSKGRQYSLVVGYPPYTPNQLRHVYWTTAASSFDLRIYSYVVASATWKVPVGTGGFSIGGNLGYAASGSFTRQISLNTMPTSNGILNINDVVPAGTAMNIALYYTDSAVIAAETTMTNWTFYANVKSGEPLPPHQYWRASVSMTSNSPAFDESPQLLRIEVTYKDAPYVLGTHVQTIATTLNGYLIPLAIPMTPTTAQTRLNNYGSKCIDAVSAVASKMNPKLSTSITGKLSITLTPEANVIDMMSKQLRGKQTVVKAGYLVNGVPVVDKYYEGIVSDANWNGSKYVMTIEDDLNIVDTQVPTTKAGPAWDGVTTYALGDIVVYGNASWESLQAGNLAHTPVEGAWWTNNGTVWQDIVYTSLTSPDAPTNWHLADVCADILTNHVNLPSQRIDFTSISAVKTAYPNMRGSRTISKPTGAIQLLTELAWLLRSQWVMRQGKLALLPEPLTASLPVATVNDYDVKKGVQYRRGWADLKNACLILSGYSGDGDGQEQFFQSYVYSDTTSVTDYEMVGIEVFKDKWAVVDTELTTRATEYVNRWKDGRRVISYNAAMRLLELETGDVITFDSVEMPPHDRSALNYIIIAQDIDWLNQTIKHTLLEV